jgi:adenine-specific DNA-methyltransferase
MPTLDWLNRADAFTTVAKVPYRLLEQVSVHTSPVRAEPVEAQGIHGNLLIQGDNLEALKALLPFYRGQVKCIFIDPPYNTKSAFEHYDDNLEHAQWLSMMLPRLQLLRELLSEDGSIWVTIDDNEGHYLKVLMDEVFGRGNFVANVVWRSSDNSNNDAKTFSVDHNQMLVFAKKEGWLSNKLDAEEKRTHFKNPDNDPRGAWFDGNPLNSPKPRENLMYVLVAPNGNRIPHPPNGWRWERETMQEKIASGEIRFNTAMTGIKRRTYLNEMKGLPPSTLWTDLLRTGHNRQAKSEQKTLELNGEIFDTPKPERLLSEILSIATNPNDLVLDSFLGSGTTAAVAHKMGRRWIGIEMGEHARTHCLPRLQKVIEGEQGGISKAVNWAGGGGFRFMRLGETVFDESGRIHPAVRFATLAAFVWQQETQSALRPSEAWAGTPYLGTHGVMQPQDSQAADAPLVFKPQFACYLLFNGILGDKRPASGNVLTREVLAALLTLHAQTPHPGVPLVVYGEACRIGAERLEKAKVTFKHIPYDVRAR